MKITNQLRFVFAAILVFMLFVTSWASLNESILTGGSKVMEIPWGVATLADAYCGFLTFFVWVAYKEVQFFRSLIWLILIFLLGNIAMSLYVLIQIYRLPKDALVEDLLLRRRVVAKP